MAFKTQCNSHQMPCSSTSFMVPVLLSTPNTLTSLHEWTDVMCLSPWENSFRPTGSSLWWSPERYRDLRTAQSPMYYQTPWLGECKATVSHYVQTWPHWISLLNYTSGAKHAARDPVERLCENSPVLTFPLKSQEPNMAPHSKQRHTTNIQCSSRGRNPVSHQLLFCYVLSGKRQTSWVGFKNVTVMQCWFKINNNKRSEPLD